MWTSDERDNLKGIANVLRRTLVGSFDKGCNLVFYTPRDYFIGSSFEFTKMSRIISCFKQRCI